MLMPPDRFDEEPGILERIRRGERIDHYETVRRRKDGTLLNISLTVSPIINALGEIVGASKIARNITERKRIEALRDCQRQALQMLAENAPLRDVLEFLIRTVEKKSSPGPLGSIVLLTKRGPGSSLPSAPVCPRPSTRR
jgi:hypothetical protein